MKRFLALVLCLITLTLCACGSNTDTTSAATTEPSEIADSFKVGNYTMTVPDGYTAKANSDHSYFITSEDRNSHMAIYALDVSLLDEAYVQEYIASQKGVFKDDDSTIYGEKTTQVNFAGTSIDMLVYVETDASGYATLNIEGSFTDSWYGYTTFLQYPVNTDKASDYASAFGEFCSTAEYTGKAPRFDCAANFPEVDSPETNPPKTNPPETDPPETDPPETTPPETTPPETTPPETTPPATDPPVTTVPEETQAETTAPTESGPTANEKSALKSANAYLRVSAFSHQGLIDQLEYEGYTTAEATYAADNCGADWNEQALKAAKSYLKVSAFSYSGLVEQLEYENFTAAQAKYGADNCGADWNEQAKKSAASYLSIMSFTRNELISQLEYEGFTHDQAVYGVEANGL